MERLRKYTTIFYCTHILDDVQRVSDTVAILNHGELVASGSIESLLAGSDGMAYHVGLKGEPKALYDRVLAQSWVSAVQARPHNGSTEWVVNVTDGTAAEQNLFRLLASDQNVLVTDYHLKEHELEEVFLNIVEGDRNVNRK
jgi:ABC-2 type transport system ATP-binding protein